MKKEAIRKAILISVCFAILPLIGLSSMNQSFEHPPIAPKYLLTLDEEADIIEDPNSNWIYYPLSGDNYDGKYAVALSEKGKTTTESSLTIESTISVNDKDVEVVGIWHNGFQDSPRELKEVKLTSNILVIDFEAFFHSYITNIEIPYSVEKIGDAAFYACPELTSVIIQNNDQEGGKSSIQCQCDGETPEGVATSVSPTLATPKSVYKDQNDVKWCSLEKIPSFCFFRCQKLNRFVPNTYLKEIEWEAFNGCYALNSPLYFYRLETIRARAFQGCSLIPSVTIYQTLFSSNENIIEPHAFNYCGSTIHFYFNNASSWLTNHPNWGINNDSGTSNYNDTDQVTITTNPESEPSAEDWQKDRITYTDSVGKKHKGEDGWIIKKYVGQVPGETWGESLLIVPEEFDGIPVRGIAAGAFENVCGTLRRLYLPKSLYYIDNRLFTGGTGNNTTIIFPLLQIISYNGDECTDQNALRDKNEYNAPIGEVKESNAKYLERRIDLSRLTSLEFIGRLAFTGLGIRKDITINANTGACTANQGGDGNGGGITSIHLPYRLISVGDEAFSAFGTKYGVFRKLTRFIWDYKEPDGSGLGSRLETIGESSFWKFGRDTDKETQVQQRPPYRKVEAATLVFPKTFKYFGVLSSGPKDISYYKTNYGFEMGSRSDRNNRPGHAFTGSSMIGKVYFKGGDSGTSDLYIPSQTFSFCDSLRTLVCEERWDRGNNKEHIITFHTQNGAYSQSAVGSDSSEAKSDFRKEPGLQTIVLPNVHTRLRIQKLAFQGSSRGAMYFSGNENDQHLFGNNATPQGNGNGQWPKLLSETTGDTTNLDGMTQWDTIGDESFFSEDTGGATGDKYLGYLGYAFDAKNDTTFRTSAYNNIDAIRFGIDQRIPKYWNVHYKEVVNEPGVENVEIEVGDDEHSSKFFTTNGKCAYVCDSDTRKATMSKYLFDQTGTNYNTAKVLGHVASHIPGTETSFDSVRYEVNKIGDSAFSAAFYDGETNDDKSSTPDTLNTIEVPDSIVEIGEYALMRAYGVRYFGVKNTDGTYNMPTSLRYIGKYAFLFCSVEAFNKIPFDCVFFENTETNANGYNINEMSTVAQEREKYHAYMISSVFSNNVYLRRITFLDATKTSEVFSSRYYSTATYSNKKTGRIYTTALYADNVNTYKDVKGEGKPFYKKNRLLLVLGRDSDDKLQPGTDVTVYGTNKVRFDAKHGISNPNPFLFGAFRMATWADSINVGPGTTKGEDSGKTFTQPLFSGAYYRSQGKMNNAYIRLHQNIPHYSGIQIDLEEFTGDTLRMPQYGLDQCKGLKKIEFPDEQGGVIPSGLFLGVANTDLTYETSTNSTKGILDLTNTGYSKIGANVFNGNVAIESFVAPITAPGSKFTIDESAFEGCTGLKTVDFSNVQGTLELNANAFKNCGIQTIIWPAGKTEINGDGIFSDNTSLTSLVLPANTSTIISQNCFYGCTNLESVTVENGSMITEIGTSAFQNCTKLNDFDFDSFTNLATIGDRAFMDVGKNGTGLGAVSFPSHITSFGNYSFNGANITHVIFNNTRSSGIHLGDYAFANEGNLTGVHFVHSDCKWLDGESSRGIGTFNSCGQLTEVQLPSTFPLTASGDYVNGSENAVYYLHSKQYGANISAELIKRKDQGVDPAPVRWLVTSAADLIANFETGVLKSGVVKDGGDGFWLLRNGDECAVDLGKLHDYSTDDGSLVFENKTLYCINNSASLVDNGALTSAATTKLYYDNTTKTILGRASEYDSSSNSVVFENGMRLMTNATSAYVEVKTVDELLKLNGNLLDDATSTNYYYLDHEGNVIYLGKAVAYNSTTKAISFSNDGGSTFSYLCKASDADDLISGGNLIANATNTYYYGIDAGNFNRIIVFGKAVSYDSSSGTVLFENDMRLSQDKILHPVSDADDLIENDGLASGANNKKYYYVDADHNDAIVSLGSAVSYDSSSGTVLFENGDMRINSSGRLLIPVMTIDSLVSEGSPTSEALTTYYYYVDPTNDSVIDLGKASSYSSGGLTFDEGITIHPVAVSGDLLDNGALISGATTSIYFYYIDSAHENNTISLGKALAYDGETVRFATDMRLDADGHLYHLIESSTELTNGSDLVDNAETTYYWIVEGNTPILLGLAQSYDEKSKTVLFPDNIRVDVDGHVVHEVDTASSLIDPGENPGDVPTLVEGATTTYYWYSDSDDTVVLLERALSTSVGSVLFESGYTMKSDNVLYITISSFSDVVSDGELVTNPTTVYSFTKDDATTELGTALSYDPLIKTAVFSNGVGIDGNDNLVYQVANFADLVENNGSDYQWKTGVENRTYFYMVDTMDDTAVVYLGTPELFDSASGTKSVLFASGLCVDEYGHLVYPFESVEALVNNSSLTEEAESTYYFYDDPASDSVIYLGTASNYTSATSTITFSSGLSVRQIVDTEGLLNDNDDGLASGLTNLYFYYVDITNYGEILYLGQAQSYHAGSETVLFTNNMRLNAEGHLFRLVDSSSSLVTNHDLASGTMDNYYWFNDNGTVVILGHAVSCDERYDSVLFANDDLRVDADGHLVHKLTTAASLIDGEGDASELIAGASGTYYWFLDGEVAVLLEKAESASNGSVLFTSGYSMDSGNILYKGVSGINDLIIDNTFAADPSTVYSFEVNGTPVDLGTAESYDEASGTALFSSGIRLGDDHLLYLVTLSGDLANGGALITGATDTYYYYIKAETNEIVCLGKAVSYDPETQQVTFSGDETNIYSVDADGNLIETPRS